MGKTGQTSDISYTGFDLTVISISGPSYSGDMVECPDLSLAVGSCVPVEPADLVTPGEITVRVEHDEDYDPDDDLMVKRDVTITHPVPAGLTNGATDVYADAFVKSYEPDQAATGVRREAELVIQVAGFPTKTAAS